MRAFMPSDPMTAIEEFVKALANENRLRILTCIFADGLEHTVGEVAEAAGLGQSTISEHLKQLKGAGLLVSRKEGKEVYYRADRNGILARLDSLRELLKGCC